MEIVTIKFQKPVLKNIDKAIKDNNYNSRTEFVREAVRDKLETLNRHQLAEEFVKRFYGKAKVKTTREQNRKVQEQVMMELAKERGIKLPVRASSLHRNQ